MKIRSAAALAILTAVGLAAPVHAQSLSTGFGGTLTTVSSPLGGGAYFSITALHPEGITINSFDLHFGGTGAHAALMLYRPGSYVGVEQNIGAWLHLGEQRLATAAGAGNPTPTAIGGLYIPSGATYSFRQGQMAGTARMQTEAQLAGSEVLFNDDLRITRGAAQSNGYIFSTVFSPRGWNGTIYYSIGGSAPEGACCLPDGTCSTLRRDDCRLQFGTYQGDGSTCGGVPGGCPQPADGACCLSDGSCSVQSAAGCAAIGGYFNGYGTTCSASACNSLATPFLGPTIGAGMFSGHFFTITAGPSDVIINGLDVNCSASAGTNTTVKIHTRPGTWEGFTDDPTAWEVHAEVPAVSAGNEQPTRVRLPLGRQIRIPAGETIAIRIGASTGGLRYTTTTFTPFVEDPNLRMDFGATQANIWSTIATARTWSGTVYYTLGESGPQPCYANCDGSTIEPVLNIDDFTCFINEFATGLALPPEQQVTAYANCDGSTTAPVLNIDDFTCFINAFAQGCP